jgi:hypothetical protein
MDIEAELAAWEEGARQPNTNWAYTTEEATFPPEAVFRNRYHVYVHGMWSARVWNHYRWARILVNQTIIELDDLLHTLDSQDRERHLDTIRRTADELLVSLPTHFRHPRLTRAQRDLIDQTCTLPPGAAGGTGSASVPSVLAQLKVAGSAPGVPSEWGLWALRVTETVWAETGMLQAQVLAEPLRAHLEQMPRVKIEEVQEVEEQHLNHEYQSWLKNESLAVRPD